MITCLIALSPIDSPFSSPSHLYLLSPPSLLYLTSWISLGVPGGGEHLGNLSLARLGSPLLTPPLLLITSISFLPLLFSVELCEPLWVFQTVESKQGIDYWLDCTLTFWFPLFSSWLRLSLSHLFSSPCNSVNLSGCPSLWRIFPPLT